MLSLFFFNDVTAFQDFLGKVYRAINLVPRIFRIFNLYNGEDSKIKYYFPPSQAKRVREEDDFRENFEILHRDFPRQVRKQ